MKRLIIQSCLVLLCASSVVFSYKPPASPRAKYNFNPGWKLLVGDPAGAESPGFDDSAWKGVTLPRAWNEDDAFRKDIKDLSTGVVWYRKRFRLPAGSAGTKVFIEFEGIKPCVRCVFTTVGRSTTGGGSLTWTIGTGS